MISLLFIILFNILKAMAIFCLGETLNSEFKPTDYFMSFVAFQYFAIKRLSLP